VGVAVVMGWGMFMLIGALAPEQVSSPDPRHVDNHEHDDGGDRPSGWCWECAHIMGLFTYHIILQANLLFH